MAEEVAGPPANTGGGTPTGGRTAGELREVADALRSRVDLFGKALAAIAALGTSAVGLTKIGDLFPVSGWGWPKCGIVQAPDSARHRARRGLFRGATILWEAV